MKKSLLVLGSTGSIGTQTLDLVRGAPDSLALRGLAAHGSWELLRDQAREFRPEAVALVDEDAAALLAAELPRGVRLFTGEDAVDEMIRSLDFDLCVHGIVGASGLAATLAVLERGKPLALANKESLVLAGTHVMALARERGAEVIPVDSEHCAIFQCLRGEDPGHVRRLLLTGSGGPFRTLTRQEISAATPEMALRHPNWDMGPRITVGSATLMNKALEVIELHHLFGLDADQIQVAIHPQSIVHSMVEFVDGSVIAQMGPPDMRGPIWFALHHPRRAPVDLAGFDVATFSTLTFEEPDPERFPALDLGYRALRAGADAGAVLNAADEIAVEAFLKSRIAFDDICRINEQVLDGRPGRAGSVDELLAADAWARVQAEARVRALAPTV